MSLYLEQRFLLGRFHATRWNQGAFGDQFGEWPPSPWRLFRALTFRWFQWSRETGSSDFNRFETLLKTLAWKPPEFYIPAFTWLGQPIKQYLPIELAWTDPSAKASAFCKPKTTLNEDHYHAIAPAAKIYWAWPDINKFDPDLLDALLVRMLYFGRAESWTQIRRVDALPSNKGSHCVLVRERADEMVPVLSAKPEEKLDVSALLATTEDDRLREHDIPPGTTWLYATRPDPPVVHKTLHPRQKYPSDLRLIQFAVGGQVFPAKERWIIVAERFRGMVLRNRFYQITGKPKVSYSTLSPVQKEEVMLLSGKGAEGKPLLNHPHAYFALIPDKDGLPVRMIVWRKSPFTDDEINAMLTATKHDISWDKNTPQWALRLLPLPFDIPHPPFFDDVGAKVWQSLTPFVPPFARHQFRKNGKERSSEAPESIIIKLLRDGGFPSPESIETLTADGRWNLWNSKLSGVRKTTWMMIHKSFQIRHAGESEREVAPGYYLRLTFKNPIKGPIALGESCHFGLGIFFPHKDKKK